MIRNFSRAALVAAVLASLSFQTAFAHDIKLGSLSLSGAFTRAMAPTAKAGGGYISITNTGSESDRLVSASSPAAPMVQLHEMKMEGDVMKMGELPDGVVIPAGETVELAPGGLHVMFMNVLKPFVEGDLVPVTLTFEKAGSIEVMFPVEAIGATASTHEHH